MSEEELYTLWKADKESHLDFEMWLYNKGGADERAKVLDEFEQFYISYNERKCEKCNDDSEYACFKCMMKKFKEQKNE